jgi:uncharacterized repeat protein (TIGR01451 family)
MLRSLAIPLTVLAALVAVAPAHGATLPATVKVVDCSPDDASAAFYGRMRSVDGSDRMWMRFRLFERQFERFTELKALGLSRWRRSKPGVSAFGYRQEVRGLRAGGEYRVLVSYRWYADDGTVMERTRRRSAVCRQYEGLPNLASTVVRAERTKVPGVVRYLIAVSNTGAAPAKGVELRLTVDGGVVDSNTVAALAPGERREVGFRGPACASSVESLADPAGVIAETSEQDNLHRLACADVPQR